MAKLGFKLTTSQSAARHATDCSKEPGAFIGSLDLSIEFKKLYLSKTLYNVILELLLILKPHFYIVKLGFTGVHIIFLISAQNIDYGYLLEPPH